jgi:hypothetical protein
LALAASACGARRLANSNKHRWGAMADIFSDDLNLKIGDLL